jgi:hypothetical protein
LHCFEDAEFFGRVALALFFVACQEELDARDAAFKGYEV